MQERISTFLLCRVAMKIIGAYDFKKKLNILSTSAAFVKNSHYLSVPFWSSFAFLEGSNKTALFKSLTRDDGNFRGLGLPWL